MARRVATQVVKTAIDIEHDLPELRRPPRRLLRPGHEACMMVNRLEQCGLEFSASVEDAKAAPAEAARTVGTHMNEGRHQPARTRPSDAAPRRHQVEIADALHQARIGLL